MWKILRIQSTESPYIKMSKTNKQIIPWWKYLWNQIKQDLRQQLVKMEMEWRIEIKKDHKGGALVDQGKRRKKLTEMGIS